MTDLAVGVFPPFGFPDTALARRRAQLDRLARAGFDHVGVGDHVSFFVGAGMDGLLAAATALAGQDRLGVYVAVYLLPLRHPVLVARQLADLAAAAPGRLTFGVGVGGEDPHEVEICGVDPTSRGRRMDECLTVLRSLLGGEPTSFHGEFFELADALVLPAPSSPVPIVVGGRSDAAIRRAGRLGDGWIGIWVSSERFGRATATMAEEAAAAGRDDHPGRNAMQVWCGLAEDEAAARGSVAEAMEAMYQIPFDRFAKYSPYGSPQRVAEFLAPYVEAGCRTFNLIPAAPTADVAVDGAAEVRRLLLEGSR